MLKLTFPLHHPSLPAPRIHSKIKPVGTVVSSANIEGLKKFALMPSSNWMVFGPILMILYRATRKVEYYSKRLTALKETRPELFDDKWEKESEPTGPGSEPIQSQSTSSRRWWWGANTMTVMNSHQTLKRYRTICFVIPSLLLMKRPSQITLRSRSSAPRTTSEHQHRTV